MVLMALLFLGLTRSWLALATVVAMAGLLSQGAGGLGAAAFLYAAWRGRVSLFELAAVTVLAGGLSGWPAATLALALGLGSSVLRGMVPWRRLRIPMPDSTQRVMAGLALFVGTMCWLGFSLVASHCLAFASLEVPGRLVAAGVLPPVDSETRTGYQIDASYEYTVDGQSYRGTRFQPGHSSLTEEEAQSWVAAHSRGSQVTVYYEPWSPARSVLSREVTWLDFWVVLYSAIFGWCPLGLYLLSRSG